MKTNGTKTVAAGLLAVALAAFGPGCGEDAETDTGLSIRRTADDCQDCAETKDPIYGYGYGSLFLTACRGACCGDCMASSTNLADRLFLPLEWSVSNPGLGQILASGGYSAVYRSVGGEGVNVVIVRDQAGREGIASVTQLGYPPEGEGGVTTAP
jgi:hypothetical protein